MTDNAPYAPFDSSTPIADPAGQVNRKDLAALVEETAAATDQRKAATAARFPVVAADADYGDIGPTRLIRTALSMRQPR